MIMSYLCETALWFQDFDLSRLVGNELKPGQTTTITIDSAAFALSCDALDPPMHPQERNDHVLIVKRSHASIMGEYFTQLFQINASACAARAVLPFRG